MTFDELNLNTPLLNALQDMGFERPTTIQAKAFSVVMSGRDVVGIAQTGTGKTIAYLLPYLRQWKYSKDKVPQILILVPTRELVAQIVKLGKYISISAVGVYGGSNINTQIATVSEGADILVATPGRLIDLTMKGVVKLKPIKKLVIDEVDEMLSLGFRSQLTMILDLLPLKRQNILFSATMTDEVEALINQYFNQPIKVEAAPAGSPLSNINQVAFEVQNFNTKLNLLRLLLYNDAEMKKVLVFAATKQLADKLFADIAHLFHDQVGIIHSNKSQNHRFNSVKQFHEGNIRILIATDVVARGIDVSEVSHVINFDVPDVAENYVHRIGRTGRADKKGNAILFFTPKEMDAKAQLEALMNFDIPIEPLPENLILSDVLTLNEMPKVYQPNLELKNPRKQTSGAAFHEKKDSNKKTPNKIRHADKMKIKYGKPKTRGQKKK